MELFSTAWWSALLAIILIDLVLAGDNAIVIALAARSLPKHLQKKAIVWGTVGAIAVRTVMTLVVVWLLKIPGLMLVGGLGLLWIAYKLIADQGGEEGEHGPAATTFWGAMKTIVVADALMGIDNVLGVAGAAHGAFDLVVIGLLISVPIMVFGSTLVLKLVDRFPSIMYIGAGVLAFTAGSMVVSEPMLSGIFGTREAPVSLLRWAVIALAIVGVLGAAWLRTRGSTKAPSRDDAFTTPQQAATPSPAMAMAPAAAVSISQPAKEELSMDTVIIYVDDADYAVDFLARQRASDAGTEIAGPRRWLLVGCVPPLTRHASQWVSDEALQERRQRWLDDTVATLRPLLERDGGTITPLMAERPLLDQTRQLRMAHGAGLALDARRPKLGVDLEPIAPEQSPARSGWAVPGAVASMGTLLVLITELTD